MVCVMCVLQPGHMYYAFIVAESFFSFCIQYIFFLANKLHSLRFCLMWLLINQFY